jgi:hypothetical protein
MAMTITRSVLLFVVAALAEIGGAWMVWQAVRENRGWLWAGAGVIALGLYGFVATFQPDANFGRILPAYGGVFVAGVAGVGDGPGRVSTRQVRRRRRPDLPRRRGGGHVLTALELIVDGRCRV